MKCFKGYKPGEIVCAECTWGIANLCGCECKACGKGTYIKLKNHFSCNKCGDKEKL